MASTTPSWPSLGEVQVIEGVLKKVARGHSEQLQMCPQTSMCERFSSFTRLVRESAYTQRFCHNARYANEK